MQYARRLHRHHDNKRVVQVYDYVDVHVPMLMRMYQKRLGYRAMGYTIHGEQIYRNDAPLMQLLNVFYS